MRRCVVVFLILSTNVCLRAAETAPPAGLIRTFPGGQANTYADAIVSADGSRVFIHVGTISHDVDRYSLYEVASGKKLFEWDKRPQDEFGAFYSFSADGSRGVFVTQAHDASNTLQILHLPDGHVDYECTIPYGIQFKLTPDGKRLLRTELRPQFDSEDRLFHMEIDDVATGRKAGELKMQAGVAPLDVFSSDSNLVVIQPPARIHNLTTGIETVLESHERDVPRSYCFMDDDRRLRGVNPSGVIQTWDVKSGRELSRVEPQRLGMSGGKLSADGKWIMYGDFGAIKFENAETGREERIWRFAAPDSHMVPQLNTVRGDSVFVQHPGPNGAEIMLLRIPPLQTLTTQPIGEDHKMQAIRRARKIPANSSAAAVPAHSDSDLKSPSWWLDRAEAECAKIDDVQSQSRWLAVVMLRRASMNDLAGEKRLLSLIDKVEPVSHSGGWTPTTDLRRQAMVFDINRMVKDGKIDDAIKLARANSGPRGAVNLLGQVGIDLARLGDLKQAQGIFQQLDIRIRPHVLTTASWFLLVDNHVDAAREIADQIAVSSPAYSRIAVYDAAHLGIESVVKDFAKIPNKYRIGASQKIAAAFADRKEDAIAIRFIQSLPPKDQDRALMALVQGQLDRGDIETARKTAAGLTGNGRYEMKTHFVEALVRAGKTEEAIDDAFKDSAPDVSLAESTLWMMTKYDKLDAATKMLDHITFPIDRNGAGKRQRDEYALGLVEAYADDNRTADAEKLLATVTPSGMGAKAQEDYERASWALLAARRRGGDESGIAAARQPLEAAYKNAPGAPSRQEALLRVLRFDIATDGFSDAEKDIADCDPSLLRGIAFLVISEASPDNDHKPPDLARYRGLARLMCLTIDRATIDMVMTSAANAHVTHGKFTDWLEFAQHLPSPRCRISAFLGVADALIPQESHEPSD